MSESIVPRLSPQVEILPFGDSEYLIKHTTLHYQLKINRATLELLNLVDGTRNIRDIASELSAKFKTPLEPSNVYEKLFAGQLVDCGIIETDKIIEPKKTSGYIWLQIPIFKPHQIAWLTSSLSGLFRPAIFYPVFVFSLAWLIGVLIAFQDLSTIFTRFVQPENIVLFYFLTLVSFFFHEMGHASSCRHFGARHGTIGFGFYLVFPVFFADVSDAWRLSNGKRVIIDMAGIYMELLFYGAISILYFINHDVIWLQMVFVRLIGTIANLNPFLRYDGYWALSDLLSIPNLKSNSDLKFKASLGWVFGNKSFPLRTGRDYFLSLFGAASWIFLLLFLSIALLTNLNEIVYFPVNLFQFFEDFVTRDLPIKGETLRNFFTRFTLPFIIYFLLLRFIYQRMVTFKRRKRIVNTQSLPVGRNKFSNLI